MKTFLGDVAESIRRRVPLALLPLLVGVRFLIAWSTPSVRADARDQMGFLLEQSGLVERLFKGIQQILAGHGVRVTRLARGLPMGGDLEYVDGVTLAHALVARQELG